MPLLYVWLVVSFCVDTDNTKRAQTAARFSLLASKASEDQNKLRQIQSKICVTRESEKEKNKSCAVLSFFSGKDPKDKEQAQAAAMALLNQPKPRVPVPPLASRDPLEEELWRLVVDREKLRAALEMEGLPAPSPGLFKSEPGSFSPCDSVCNSCLQVFSGNVRESGREKLSAALETKEVAPGSSRVSPGG